MAPFGQLSCLADVSQVIVLLFGPGSTFSHGSSVDYSKVIISRYEALCDLRWGKKEWCRGWAKFDVLSIIFHVWVRMEPSWELFKIISPS